MDMVEEKIQPFHRGSSMLVQVDDEWDETAEVEYQNLKQFRGHRGSKILWQGD